MFGEDTFIMLKFKLKGKDYTIEEIVKIIDEVESLREENKSLEESVSHYQKVIEDNLAGVRCKELEGEVEQLKQTVKDLEEIIRDVDDFGGELQNQKAIIEFQKKDIECLVKLNAELQNRLDTYKEVLYFNIYSGR